MFIDSVKECRNFFSTINAQRVTNFNNKVKCYGVLINFNHSSHISGIPHGDQFFAHNKSATVRRQPCLDSYHTLSKQFLNVWENRICEKTHCKRERHLWSSLKFKKYIFVGSVKITDLTAMWRLFVISCKVPEFWDNSLRDFIVSKYI